MKKILLMALVVLGFASPVFALPYYQSTQSLLPFTDSVFNIGTTSPSNLRYNGFFNNLTVSGSCTGCGGAGNGASSTLLIDNNTFSGKNIFSNASTTLLTITTGWLPSLGTPAGTILAVDPNGKIIATTTSAGGVTAVTGTWPILSSGGNTPIISWGGLSTTTNLVAGHVVYASGVSSVTDIATSTPTATAPITYSGTFGSFVGGVGGAFGCTSASSGVTGCLTGTDWTTFNSKVSTTRTINTTFPIQGGGDLSSDRTISSAFGTTTNTGLPIDSFVYTSHTGVLVTAASSSLSLPNTALQNSTISGVALGGTLSSHSPDGTTLTGTGYNGSASVSNWALNLANSNQWTASTTFTKVVNLQNASTSLETDGTVWIPSLGTPAGTVLAVDPSGKIIATSTSAGGVTAVTGTYPIISSGGATPAISTAFSTTTNTGIGNNLILYTSASGVFAGAATGTVSGSGPITATAGQSIIGSGLTIGCTSASNGVTGCMTATDWGLLHTATTTFSSPLSYSVSTNAVTCATCRTAADTLSQVLTAGNDGGGLGITDAGAITGTSLTATSGTSTINVAMRLGTTATARDNMLQVDCSGRTWPASISVGGCLSIDGGTTNQGTLLFVHENTAAVGTGRMVNFIQDNSTVTQDMWLASSSCANCTALNIKGLPTGKGILKIEHTGNGTGYSNSSLFSGDLLNATDAQGIFVKGAVSGTGPLLNLVDSNSASLFKALTNGNFGIATATPGTLLSVGNAVNVTAATTTFYSTGGISIAAGCFYSVPLGACLGAGGASISGGTNGMLTSWTGASTLTATSGPTMAYLTSTSTIATSTFAGPVVFGAAGTVYPYVKIGSTTPNVTNRAGNFLDVVGSDNTTAGIQGGVTNINAGVSAYGCLYLNNDISDNTVTHFGALCLNSSGHTDTTFGTDTAPKNQVLLQSTDGLLSLIASTGTVALNDAGINFITGGTSGNERGRFTVGGLFKTFFGASTTQMSFFGPGYFGNTSTSTIVGNGATSTLNSTLVVASTSPNAFVIQDQYGTQYLRMSTASSTNNNPIFQFQATNTLDTLFQVDQYGHIAASSTRATPTVTCTPSGGTMDANSTDDVGGVTTGTLSTACTVTFASAYSSTPWVQLTAGAATGFPYVTARSTTGFTLNLSAAATGDDVTYMVLMSKP